MPRIALAAKLQTFLGMNRVLTRNPIIFLNLGLLYFEGLLSVNAGRFLTPMKSYLYNIRKDKNYYLK